jgi:uncharacterized membrane protein YoaK (UPF0700 family)
MITYHTYLSFMSGNTTQTGYETGQGNFGAALPSALAIVFFVGGSFAGASLVHSAVRRIRRLVFGMVASSLVLIIGFTRLGLLSDGVGIAVISFAMGAMNAGLSRVGAQSVSLTFVTGTLNGIAVHLALAVRHAPLRTAKDRGIHISIGLASWRVCGPGFWPAHCCRGRQHRASACGFCCYLRWPCRRLRRSIALRARSLNEVSA